MIERPKVFCPDCQSPAKKLISAPGIVVHNTGAMRAFVDKAKTEGAARLDLRENYGVEKINPLGGNSFGDVYRDVKATGSKVRDDMQQTREENEKKTQKKQREWAIKANKRAPGRDKFVKDKRAKEAAKKRAIRL